MPVATTGQSDWRNVKSNRVIFVRAERIGSRLFSRNCAMVRLRSARIQKLPTRCGLLCSSMIGVAIITFVVWSIVFGPAPAMAYALVNAVSV